MGFVIRRLLVNSFSASLVLINYVSYAAKAGFKSSIGCESEPVFNDGVKIYFVCSSDFV